MNRLLNSISGWAHWLPMLQPIQFVDAMRHLRVDPEDSQQGVRLFYAAGGDDDAHALAVMKASAEGQRILDSREHLSVSAADRAYLRTLPAGSLGHALAAFHDEEDISCEGLAGATAGLMPEPRNAEAGFFRDRCRDVHDVLHVLTGYGRDYLGEAVLHGFTYAQYHNHAYAFLGAFTCLGLCFLGRRDAPGLFIDAYRRGRRAESLAAVDWNALMDEPVEALRARFQISPPPAYVPLDSSLLAAKNGLASTN